MSLVQDLSLIFLLFFWLVRRVSRCETQTRGSNGQVFDSGGAVSVYSSTSRRACEPDIPAETAGHGQAFWHDRLMLADRRLRIYEGQEVV